MCLPPNFCSDQVNTWQKLELFSNKTCTSYLYGKSKNQIMTYAIIETGGKQLRVEPGRFYDIELLSAEPDETVTLETVLLVQHNGDVSIGQPFVDGATVEGKVMRHLRGRKVIVYKMKPKKKTRKKRGHRQEITRLMINSISLNGSVLTYEADVTDEAQADAITPVADADPVEVAAENIPETTDAVVTEATTGVMSEVAETTDESATDVAEIAAEPEADESATDVAETIPETTDEPATAVTSEVASEVAPETADEPATAVAEIVAEPEAESQS